MAQRAFALLLLLAVLAASFPAFAAQEDLMGTWYSPRYWREDDALRSKEIVFSPDGKAIQHTPEYSGRYSKQIYSWYLDQGEYHVGLDLRGYRHYPITILEDCLWSPDLGYYSRREDAFNATVSGEKSFSLYQGTAEDSPQIATVYERTDVLVLGRVDDQVRVFLHNYDGEVLMGYLREAQYIIEPGTDYQDPADKNIPPVYASLDMMAQLPAPAVEQASVADTPQSLQELELQPSSAAYYLNPHIKCVSMWTFFADAKTQFFPMYADHQLYNISVIVPEEAASWLANLNRSNKEPGYLGYARKANHLQKTSVSDTGGFWLTVKENETKADREAVVTIVAEPKSGQTQIYQKEVLIRQLAAKIDLGKTPSTSVEPEPRVPGYGPDLYNVWLWPSPGRTEIGQLYGRYNTLLKFHPAIDIRPGETKQIVAARDGHVVKVVPYGENGGTAVELTLKHILGDHVFYTFYLHMESNSIPKALRQEGAYVKAGEIIGKMGNTGDSSGTHLHFAIYMEMGKANKRPDGRPDAEKFEKPDRILVLNTLPVHPSSVKPNKHYGNLSYSPEGIFYVFDPSDLPVYIP